MGTLYENIISLCNAKGVKPGKMCTEAGISKGLISDLKAGRRTGVSAVTAQKMADYFGVTVAYLLGEEKEKPLAGEDQELEELLEELKNRDECRMLFQLAKDATADEVRQAVKIIEALRK